MDKSKLVQAFATHLEEELTSIKAAARATHEAATHEESKPENEYDTRAIEASYLAGAQAKRAGEIDEVLSLFHNLNFKGFAGDEPISATALVTLESERRRRHVLIMPKGGGFNVTFEGGPVQIVTPHSLLGEAILGLTAGDFAEVEIAGDVKEYKILEVR